MDDDPGDVTAARLLMHCRRGELAEVESLLMSGASADGCSSKKTTPLRVACFWFRRRRQSTGEFPRNKGLSPKTTGDQILGCRQQWETSLFEENPIEFPLVSPPPTPFSSFHRQTLP